MSAQLDAVTGAFGYSGAAIARRLVEAGHPVRTLTGHPGRAPAGTQIDVHPLAFDDPAVLVSALRSVHTLFNTFWIRFAHGATDHDWAVAAGNVLFDAAKRAGVARIVHVSITNPSLDSPYSYFRGKAEVEAHLAGLGVPLAIVRPAILFGGDGVLINNIAWLLRHLPVFAIGGRGDYRIRGIHVDDLAQLCVSLGTETDDRVVDAVGPQSLSFRDLVGTVRSAVGSRAVIVPVQGRLVPGLSRVLSVLLRDQLLTGDEYAAMADGLAHSEAESTGTIAFTDWVAENAGHLGRHYANELHRHFDA